MKIKNFITIIFLALFNKTIAKNNFECFSEISFLCDYNKSIFVLKDEEEILNKSLDQILRKAEKNHDNFSEASKYYEIAIKNYNPLALFKYAKYLENFADKINSSNHYYLKSYKFGYGPAKEDYIRSLNKRKQNQKKLLLQIDEKNDLLVEMRKIDSNRIAFSRNDKETYYMYIYNTNAIEGNSMKYSDVRALIETSYINGFLKDILEVNGSIKAFGKMKDLLLEEKGNHIRFTEKLINRLHHEFYVSINHAAAGVYRKHDVRVGHHLPPRHEDIPDLMKNMIEWLNSQEFHSLHPIEKAAIAHFTLVWIHPYEDGNGRTSRLLMNFILMFYKYPVLVIKSDKKDKYFSALEKCNLEFGGDINIFVEYIINQMDIELNDIKRMIPMKNDL